MGWQDSIFNVCMRGGDDDETGVKQTRRVLARFSWITSSCLLLTMYGWLIS